MRLKVTIDIKDILPKNPQWELTKYRKLQYNHEETKHEFIEEFRSFKIPTPRKIVLGVNIQI